MSETVLERERDDRRSLAIRSLLARPFLDARSDPIAFRSSVRERNWLAQWFEETLGWPLHIDVRGGWACLSKRREDLDATRPARRKRGAKYPFDRRRYQLLCLACAELSARPVTTIAILASAITAASVAIPEMDVFDSAKAKDRSAFVDALKMLESWGVVDFSSGEVESYVASVSGNALLDVDGARLHRLLACARAPSVLAGGNAKANATRALAREPRYGENPLASEDDKVRTRWLRHRLARRLLDDPVIYAADLLEAEREYLAHRSGRRWLLERAHDAGFVVEQRAEGLMAIDPDRVATDERFSAPNDNVKQAALLLVGRFTFEVPSSATGAAGGLVTVDLGDLASHLSELMRKHKSWAKKYRGREGPRELAEAAVSVLVRFGLAKRTG